MHNSKGIMAAVPGDYIIKRPDGEFYPCDPVVFDNSYQFPCEKSVFKDFGYAIGMLKQGKCVRRSGWNGKGMFVVKQVPASIGKDIIPKMQSLPVSAKSIILNGKGSIDYNNQCLIYNENTGKADSWVPSISDVFSEDWEVVE